MRAAQNRSAGRMEADRRETTQKNAAELHVNYTTSAAARDYTAAGFALCATNPKNNKQPAGGGWQKNGRPADFWAQNHGHGIGLVHGLSGTCALDLDELDKAHIALEAVGVNLEALLADGVQIHSGKYNSGKLLYRFPSNLEPKRHALQWGDSCILELRAGAVHDVLPPSVHPETGTVYEWQGDWQNLPELPESLIKIWQNWPLAREAMQAASPDAPNLSPREQRALAAVKKPDGDSVIHAFNEAHDVGAILERHGYRAAGRRWLAPDSSTGIPGVALLSESDAQRQIVFSHHGSCPLADGQAHDCFDVWRILEHGGDMRKAVKSAAKILGMEHKPTAAPVAAKEPLPEPVDAPDDTKTLPALPGALAALPDGLGLVQDWIHGRMVYPCRFTAGWSAIATLTGFAQTLFTIDSQAGLGFNEFYLTLAPTGYGKESLRDSLPALAGAVVEHAREKKGDVHALQAIQGQLPFIESSAPSSAQGLHSLLEAAGARRALPSAFIQSDEFSAWLKKAAQPDGSHIFQALQYLMQTYSRALRDVHPGRAVGREYEAVKNPRLSVFATTTPQSAFDSMGADLGEMGAWNRFVTFLAPDEAPEKRYTGMEFEPCPDVVSFLYALLRREPEKLRMGSKAFEVYRERDIAETEPIRQRDPVLGGRLAEQAIKLAGLLCLSRDANEISGEDMATAFNIRVGLYGRVAAAAELEGGATGRHETAEALEQIKRTLERLQVMYKSDLPAYSRKFRSLSTRDRGSVLMAAFHEGWAREDSRQPRMIFWNDE